MLTFVFTAFTLLYIADHFWVLLLANKTDSLPTPLMKFVFSSLIAIVFVIAGLSMFGTPSIGKDSRLVRSKSPVAGRYIVVLNQEPSNSLFMDTDLSVETISNAMAKDHNAKIDQVYDAAIKGFSAEMSAKEAETLSRDPRVAFVEEDSIAYVSSVQSESDWGLDRIDQRELPLNGAFMYAETGQNVNVYIIDSGIRPSHQEFGGRASVAFDALSDGQNGIDCHGHGTHVAGSIGSSTYGVAKNTKLYGVRVLPCSGFGLVSHMISGVNWVTANHQSPAVVNMSINVSLVSTALDNAINNSVNAGVTYVVSAGNNNKDACLQSPGSATSAIVVGATGDNDERSPYSNYGACVDLFAPGNYIRSLSHLNDFDTSVRSGTSQAAPMVAGAAALFLESNPTASPATVANRIKLDATSGSITNIDNVSPNKLLYTWLGDSQPPVPGSVTIIKEVQTWDGQTSSSTAFNYEASNFGRSNFDLIDSDAPPADRITNSNIFLFDQPNAITVHENELPGWRLDSIDCVETPEEGMPNAQNTTVDVGARSANIVVEQGESVTCTFRSTQFAPTAAPVSLTGRLADQMGRGLKGYRVTLLDANTGETLTTISNSFGYYTFADLNVSNFYIVSVESVKRVEFQPNSRAVSLNGDLFGVDFLGVRSIRN